MTAAYTDEAFSSKIDFSYDELQHKLVGIWKPRDQLGKEFSIFKKELKYKTSSLGNWRLYEDNNKHYILAKDTILGSSIILYIRVNDNGDLILTQTINQAVVEYEKKF